MGFAVFNGDDNRVGTLFYHSAEGMILFLYSPSPFTITGTKTLSGETHEINAAFGTGWNTSLIPQGNKKGLIYTGTPPADAKWVFTKNF
jgi:hypothetical protein